MGVKEVMVCKEKQECEVHDYSTSISWLMVFAQKHEGSNGHAGSGEAGPSGAKLSAEDARLIAEDDEEIDMDELDEAELDDLEAKLEEQTRHRDEKGERG